MQFPLSFEDASLWLAITAIVLLTTSELLSPYYGKTHILIEKRRLRIVALATGLLFILTAIIRVYQIISS